MPNTNPPAPVVQRVRHPFRARHVQVLAREVISRGFVRLTVTDAMAAMPLPAGDGFIWAAGEHRLMADLRKLALSKPGVNPKRMRIASYWKQGETGHHEELSAND